MSQIRVPSNLIGKLLDHGKTSAHALKLLAIKMTKGDGFVLNETFVKDRYRVNHKTFKAGIRLMKKTGVLERSQPNHRDYAKEKLAGKNGNFVMIDETLLMEEKSANLIGFILAIKVSPTPGLPADFAKRVGITSRGTAQRLAKEALRYGCDVLDACGSQPMMIGRGGTNFELFKKGLSKKGLSKKGPAHSRWKNSTVDGKTPQKMKTLCYGTRSCDRGHADENLKEREIVLKAWNAGRFWQDNPPEYDGVIDLGKFCIDRWRGYLRDYGGAPKHLETMHSFKQVVEIAYEFAERGFIDDPEFVLPALAYWICKAHADGKVIRSLSFIAEAIARQVENSDWDWCYGYPSRLSDADNQRASGLSAKAVSACENCEVPVIGDMLSSTRGIEDLHELIQRYGENAVIHAINHVNNNRIKPEQGRNIIRWVWFERYIQVETKQTRKRK